MDNLEKVSKIDKDMTNEKVKALEKTPDKTVDLDNLIDNLKKDLELKFTHPRSPSKFIDKTEYLK
jgi:hypothetical protein